MWLSLLCGSILQICELGLISTKMQLPTGPGLFYAAQIQQVGYSLARNAGCLELCIFRWMFRSVLNFWVRRFSSSITKQPTRFVDGSWGNSWACCHDTFSLVLEPFLRPRTILWMSWYCIDCPLTVASTSFVNVLSSALNDSSSLDASKILWICCIDQEVSDVRGMDENVVSMVRLLLETRTRAKKNKFDAREKEWILVFICSMSSSCTGSSSPQWKASALGPNRRGINLVGDISYWLRSTRAANTSERKILVTSGPSRSAYWKLMTCVICNGTHTLISSYHFHREVKWCHGFTF